MQKKETKERKLSQIWIHGSLRMCHGPIPKGQQVPYRNIFISIFIL